METGRMDLIHAARFAYAGMGKRAGQWRRGVSQDWLRFGIFRALRPNSLTCS